ncbi:hypothetical protein AMTR_s00029p00167770 [Amborella trichopoda]|uniref:Uncharacterized protein n=1 Tax=Amborella trichopoda TaxID=13333 RepID=W1PHV9_AMBTC|nr:hypothetical protein AMTR_s00029p00167770 [Amborella trichopoda]
MSSGLRTASNQVYNDQSGEIVDGDDCMEEKEGVGQELSRTREVHLDRGSLRSLKALPRLGSARQGRRAPGGCPRPTLPNETYQEIKYLGRVTLGWARLAITLGIGPA